MLNTQPKTNAADSNILILAKEVNKMNDLRKARDNFILEASLILAHHLKRATGQADILDVAECDNKNHSNLFKNISHISPETK